MKKPDKERTTVEVTNIIYVFDSCSNEYMKKMHMGVYPKVKKGGRTLVEAHKELFGKQTYCWTGSESRFWVWDYESWRVYVNNDKGIIIEVAPKTSVGACMTILRSYWSKFEL